MERAAWSEQRLDDLAAEMRNGFERVDRDMRDLRVELKGEVQELRQIVIRIGGGLIGSMALGFLSVFAAILIRGA
jgi:hypothetical protein